MLVLVSIEFKKFECKSGYRESSRKERFKAISISADHTIIFVESVADIVPVDQAEIFEHFVNLWHSQTIVRIDRGLKFQEHRFRNGYLTFVETYMDAGYMDMHEVMRALREVEFEGAVMSDHLPAMVGGRRAAEAWSIGYMRALIQAVNNEFGGA